MNILTAQDKMESLYKALDFNSKEEYFNYCADSYINGQMSQCRKLFSNLPHEYKHELIEYLRDNVGNDEIHNFFVRLF